MIGYLYADVGKVKNFQLFFGEELVCLELRPYLIGKCRAILGWGRRPSAKIARLIASKFGKKFIQIEDGFLRSLGLGVNGAPPYSIIQDEIGLYYDATCPSYLEKIIVDSHYSDVQIERSRNCINKIKKNRLTKYNTTQRCFKRNIEFKKYERSILVVDQRLGDTSIPYGLASEDTFKFMLETAIDENPDSEILIKTHPDALIGGKKSHYSKRSLKHNCQLIIEEYNPWSIFESVDHVYVVSSLMGFEALMADKKVSCFGVPFYSGWGLTDDRIALKRRERKVTLETLFYAAYIEYSKYINHKTKTVCEIEEVINDIIENNIIP